MHGHRLMLASLAASAILLAANKGDGSGKPAADLLTPAPLPEGWRWSTPEEQGDKPPFIVGPSGEVFETVEAMKAALSPGEPGEPGSPSELDQAKARIAALERENSDLVSASETAIGELQAKLAQAETDVRLARQREDKAVEDYNRAVAELNRLKDGAAAAPGPAPSPVHDGPFVVMQTSAVADTAGRNIARGRVATGDTAALLKLLDAGKARRAKVAEVEAAGRDVAVVRL